MWVIIYHIASMWILTPINIYKQNMWGIYIGSMWILTIIQEKKKEKKERVRRVALCCHPQFSHFYHAKKMTSKIY